MKKFLTLLFLVFASSSYGQKMIDIGYHNLFVSDRGPHNASFTVVFESGGGGGADDWEKVIAGLPPEIRTIAYDRSGTGRSEHGPEPATMAQEVFELHNLLKALRVRGNIILTGQSFGGLLVRLYAGQYGTNVAGIVLVDPAHESGLFGSLKYGGWVRLRETAEGRPVPPTPIEIRSKSRL